jgi:hypothetical protein
MPTPFWYLTALPFLLAMAALGGSLLALAVAALGAMGHGFGGAARRSDDD